MIASALQKVKFRVQNIIISFLKLCLVIASYLGVQTAIIECSGGGKLCATFMEGSAEVLHARAIRHSSK